MRVARWFWALLALWAVGYAAFSWWLEDPYLRMPPFAIANLVEFRPLIGLPAVIILLLPILALPFALRRPKPSQET